MANKDDMQTLYDKLLKRYSFLNYTKEDLERILKESKNTSTNIRKIAILLDNELAKVTSGILRDNSKAFSIFNEFINNNLSSVKRYEKAIIVLRKFSEFFSRVNSESGELNSDVILNLINGNQIIANALRLVINKHYSSIKNDNYDFIDNNELLISMISRYFDSNAFKIEEKLDDIDEDYLTDSEDYEEKERIEERIFHGRIDNSVRDYLREIGKYPLLNPDEEKELARRVANGDQVARGEFIERNLRLVVSVAKQYVGKGIHILDLIQEGNAGLITAVDRFDVNRGCKFSTYATWWIMHAMVRSIKSDARNIRIPVNVHIRLSKFLAITDKIRTIENREPTLEEIAEIMALPIQKVTELATLQHDTVSLSTPVGDDDSELGDNLSSGDSSIEETIFKKYLEEHLYDIIALANLKKNELIVLECRFGLKTGKTETLEEVGAKLNLTRERVRQIEANALRKLRRPQVIRKLRDYAENPDGISKPSKISFEKARRLAEDEAKKNISISVSMEEIASTQETHDLVHRPVAAPQEFYKLFWRDAKSEDYESAKIEIRAAFELLGHYDRTLIIKIFGENLDGYYNVANIAKAEERYFKYVLSDKMRYNLEHLYKDGDTYYFSNTPPEVKKRSRV